MRHTMVAAAGAAGLVALIVTPMSPANAADDATVSVLHAAPGLTVDVYANGDELIPDFKPGTLTDPLSLPAGTYDLRSSPTGTSPPRTSLRSRPTALRCRLVPTRPWWPIWQKGADPALTLFANDTSATSAGEARLTVRHTAAAPAVDVRANGDVLFAKLTNPNEASADSRPTPTPQT